MNLPNLSRAILITRPSHDRITTYLFFWSEQVINQAIKSRVKVLDLSKQKATRVNFISYNNRHNPKLVFLNGHGDKNSIAGHHDETILEVGDEQELFGKIVYARSCEVINNFGQISVSKGTKAFIGYQAKFFLAMSGSTGSKPKQDKVAKRFLEPSNLIVNALLKGNPVGIAYQRSQAAMHKNIIAMLSTNASQLERDSAQYLWANRTNQKVIGDLSATI